MAFKMPCDASGRLFGVIFEFGEYLLRHSLTLLERLSLNSLKTQVVILRSSFASYHSLCSHLGCCCLSPLSLSLRRFPVPSIKFRIVITY